MDEATANITTAPTSEEQQVHSLTLRNGIELQLGIQDQLIVTHKKIAHQYPHHLIHASYNGIFSHTGSTR